MVLTISSDVVPDSEKSNTQSLKDKTSREKDSHSNESTMDKIKNAVTPNK